MWPLLVNQQVTQLPSVLGSCDHFPRDLFSTLLDSLNTLGWGGVGWGRQVSVNSLLFISLSLLWCLSAPSSMVHLTLPFNEGHPPCKYHIKHIENGSTERFPSRKVTAKRHHFPLFSSALVLKGRPQGRQRHPLLNTR